ncbi:MAG: AraC family transcriptional regulator [Spirochaetaceae bacterium]|jgi:AraC-like DNA-binding protein|nr:AraC family transcriptional regulator [Spirochaetaceae bacterium]
MENPEGPGVFEDEHFVVPDSFLERFSDHLQAQLLMVTDIGCYPRALYHACSRPQGSKSAILIYCREGLGYYALRGRESHTLSAGQLIIIPPITPHEYGSNRENPWTIFWIHLNGFLFYPFYEMVSSTVPVRIPEIYGTQLIGLFRQCFNILKWPYGDEEFLYLCQLATAMLALIPCAAKQPADSLSTSGIQGIERAFAFMKEHLREPIGLNELAEAARFSPSHLYYLFKQSTGCAPIEYFLRLKIRTAAKEVYFSNLPIRDIAETYGIEDPYYFSRLFKKIMGIAPTQYRKRGRG